MVIWILNNLELESSCYCTCCKQTIKKKKSVPCRHLMGEDLESLNPKELQQLEQQLDSSLKHIRSRKVVTVVLLNL
jgi:hypothetical protein